MLGCNQQPATALQDPRPAVGSRGRRGSRRPASVLHLTGEPPRIPSPRIGELPRFLESAGACPAAEDGAGGSVSRQSPNPLCAATLLWDVALPPADRRHRGRS
jgi:hypothetical protein